MRIKLSYHGFDEDDNEVEFSEEFPAIHEVCHRCEGHGSILNPSIGHHAYTREEFNEAFDDEGREQYFTRGGMYDIQCPTCKGKRVIIVRDKSFPLNEEQKAFLQGLEAFEKEEAEYEQLCVFERRMGC